MPVNLVKVIAEMVPAPRPPDWLLNCTCHACTPVVDVRGPASFTKEESVRDSPVAVAIVMSIPTVWRLPAADPVAEGEVTAPPEAMLPVKLCPDVALAATSAITKNAFAVVKLPSPVRLLKLIGPGSEPVPQGFADAVADYFRKLSKTKL